MIKFFTYFLQSIVIYIFFILGKIIGLTLKQKIFFISFFKNWT